MISTEIIDKQRLYYQMYRVREIRKLQEEIDNISVRSEYLKKLTKTKMIAPSNNYIVAEELGHNYAYSGLHRLVNYELLQ